MKMQPQRRSANPRLEPRRALSRAVRGVLAGGGLAVVTACSPSSSGMTPPDGGETDSAGRCHGSVEAATLPAWRDLGASHGAS